MNRKDEHVALAKAFYRSKATDFDLVQIVHQSLPQCRLEDVDLSTEFLGRTFSAPFFINAMTGGSEKTKEINHQLAEIAQACDLLLATGSVSAALKDPILADSYTIVRETYPNGFLVANVGAGTSVANGQKAVELFQADALQIHLNAPQELVMPEGDRDFSQWLSLIQQTIQAVSVPVIVKEVGFGMTREAIQQLLDVGVKTIDISGRGGTSFTQIENARRPKRELAYLNDYGQSTVVSLLEANEVDLPFDLLASGGIRGAEDIFKSLILGAKSVGLSGEILQSLLTKGIASTIELIQQWKAELRLLYGLCGHKKTGTVPQTSLVFHGEVKDWCQARQIDLTKYAFPAKR